jgi:hypothetical protein
MGTDAFEPGCSFQHRQPVFSRLMAIGYWQRSDCFRLTPYKIALKSCMLSVFRAAISDSYDCH